MKRNHVSEQGNVGYRRGIVSLAPATCQSALKYKMPAPALSANKERTKNMAAAGGSYEYPDSD